MHLDVGAVEQHFRWRAIRGSQRGAYILPDALFRPSYEAS